MRCESCQRQLKFVANIVCGSINLLVSIAIKQMLKMCRINLDLHVTNTLELGSVESLTNDFKTFNNIKINNTTYSKDTVGVVDSFSIEKMFGRIEKIIVSNDITVQFQLCL